MYSRGGTGQSRKSEPKTHGRVLILPPERPPSVAVLLRRMDSRATAEDGPTSGPAPLPDRARDTPSRRPALRRRAPALVVVSRCASAAGRLALSFEIRVADERQFPTVRRPRRHIHG